MVGDPQDGDTTNSVIYSGSCRKELNKFNQGGITNVENTSQLRLSLPIVVSITFGDVVSVTDEISTIKGVVSDWELTNIYHTNESGVYYLDANNNPLDIGNTSTKGMHVYVDIVKH